MSDYMRYAFAENNADLGCNRRDIASMGELNTTIRNLFRQLEQAYNSGGAGAELQVRETKFFAKLDAALTITDDIQNKAQRKQAEVEGLDKAFASQLFS